MNKSIKDIFLKLLIVTFLFLNSCEKDEKTGLPVDGDGNVYDTVRIGTQTWLKENLKTTKYNNGDPIPHITNPTEWSTFWRGAYCWYDNNPDYNDTYGALYNWHAAKLADFICPVGWRVPTLEEWTTLINNLGGEYEAGCRLKEAGFQHWGAFNKGTNESGFTALPGGIRYFVDGTYQMIRELGSFWASDVPYKIGLTDDACMASKVSFYRATGLSIRCIKDR
ncbi:MAG: fibrobacter succinogenes major paralogous domain-containing protein [Bacteroidales bacterium]|nr:fibrobacter succinogenes major paralogous domain-containing protein [Bacteroidales bacterium]